MCNTQELSPKKNLSTPVPSHSPFLSAPHPNASDTGGIFSTLGISSSPSVSRVASFHTYDSGTEYDLHSLLSPALSLALPLSRQPSVSSVRSLGTAALERPMQGIDDPNQMSLASGVRAAIPSHDALDSTSASQGLLREALSRRLADNAQEAESGHLAIDYSASRTSNGEHYEPGLVDIAQEFAEAKGGPPWVSADSLRGPRKPISADAYVVMLHAVLCAPSLGVENVAEGFLRRLAFVEHLKSILQVPGDMHAESLTKALESDKTYMEALGARVSSLTQWVAAASSADEPDHLLDPYVLDRSHFLSADVFERYVMQQLHEARTARAAVSGFAAALLIDRLRVRGLGGRGDSSRVKRFLQCCFSPQSSSLVAELQADAFYFRIWVSEERDDGGAAGAVSTGGATQSVSVTSTVPSSGEVAGGASWPDAATFATASPAAVLCFELRCQDTGTPGKARDASKRVASVRSQNYQQHRRFGVSGKIRVPVAVKISDLVAAGGGRHECTVSLFRPPVTEPASSTPRPAPIQHSPFVSRDPTDAGDLRRDPAASGKASLAQRSSSHDGLRVAGLLTFVFEPLVITRAAGDPRVDASDAPTADAPRPSDERAAASPLLLGHLSPPDGTGDMTGMHGFRDAASDAKDWEAPMITPRITSSLPPRPPLSGRTATAMHKLSHSDMHGSRTPHLGSARPRFLLQRVLAKRGARWSRSGHRGHKDSARRQGDPIGASAVVSEIFVCLWTHWRELAAAGAVPDIPEHSFLQPPTSDTVTRASVLNQLPPSWALGVIASVAAALGVRREEPMLLLMAALTTSADLDSTQQDFPDLLDAFEAVLRPLAAASSKSLLTHGESAAFARGVAPVLQESLWALDRMHDVLFLMHGAGTFQKLLSTIALAVQFVPDASQIATTLHPHVRQSAARRMTPHHALTEVVSKYDAIPIFVEALRTTIGDLKLEHSILAAPLAAEVDLLQISARYRYGLLVQAVQRLWGSGHMHGDDGGTPSAAHAPGGSFDTPQPHGALLYDGLLQQFEDLFLELHQLMITLGLSKPYFEENMEATLLGKPRQAAAWSGVSPSIEFIPCQGIELLDIPRLLEPVVGEYLSTIGIKLERYAASFVAAELPPHGGWAPVSRLQSVMCTTSCIELFKSINYVMQPISARVIATRPSGIASEVAACVAEAVGGAIRWYVGAVERAALEDLRPVALVANKAGVLAPAGRALLVSDLDDDRASPQSAQADATSHQARWPAIIRRELAFKLNNIAHTSSATDAVGRRLAAALAVARDPLRVFDRSTPRLDDTRAAAEGFLVASGSQEILRSAEETRSGRPRASEPPAACLRDSTPSLGGDLSFMSDDAPLPSPRASEPALETPTPLPAKVAHIFDEVQHTVGHAKLAILGGIKHAFSAVLTHEVSSILGSAAPETPASRGWLAGLSSLTSFSAAAPGDSFLPPPPPPDDAYDGFKLDVTDAGVAARNVTLQSAASSIFRSLPTLRIRGGDAAPALEPEPPSALESVAMAPLLEIIDGELQVLKECLVPELLEEVQLALWKATCDVLEAFILAAVPSAPPLTRAGAASLESLLSFLGDYFHADGAGLPAAVIDAYATRIRRLMQLFLAPTEELAAHSEVLHAEVERAASFDRSPRDAPRAADVTQVDLLRLLRQRGSDPVAKARVQALLASAENFAMQVLFALPESERVVARADCTLMGHMVPGTLFLSTTHLCFSSMSASVARSGGSFFSAAPRAAVTMIIPLSKVTAMSHAFVSSRRAIVFTLFDKSQVEFAKFAAPEAPAEFEHAVRLHVAGTSSTLDLTLRGVEAAVAAAALKLPPGEHVVRSYACALYKLTGKRRGALHVCRQVLLFVGSKDSDRYLVRLDHVHSVEVSKGHWLRGVQVVILCTTPPHKLEICEVTEAYAEEMVAQVLDSVAKQTKRDELTY